MKEGYTKGIIVLSNIEGDCPVTIKVISDGTELFYDPINLSKEFQNDGEKIWFQYGGLRRMNRCEKASPISITAIEKRED